MFKKILITLGILVVLFAGVNTAAALNSSILDAISGLPLSDQIFYIAKEVDRLKLKDELRDACDVVKEIVNPDGMITIGGYTYFGFDHPEGILTYIQPEYGVLPDGKTTLEDLLILKARYDQAKYDCDRLTEEFDQKYGD